MSTLNHAEMTAHIRNRIKAAGIKARVRAQSCGSASIQVNTPVYGQEFSSADQRAIRHIALCNKLTLVRGMEIIIEQDTNPFEFNFYL
jgi:hypothetical protein